MVIIRMQAGGDLIGMAIIPGYAGQRKLIVPPASPARYYGNHSPGLLACEQIVRIRNASMAQSTNSMLRKR
jgi:hypothetical protein